MHKDSFQSIKSRLKHFFSPFPDRSKGFTMIEIIVVIAVLSIIITSVAIFTIDSSRFSLVNGQRIQAGLLLQESTNSILQNKNTLWGSIIDNTAGGNKHMVFNNNTYTIANGTTVVNDITLGFQIATVQRDVNGVIVASGGTNDVGTRAIVMTASWLDQLDTPYSISTTFYINSWNTTSWKRSLQAEFATGTVTDTLVTATGDGAIELDLESIIRGDWCLPELTDTKFNLTGLSFASTIWANPGHAYMGTSAGTDGPTLNHVALSIDNPPHITEVGRYDTATRTNDVWSDGTYAYIATDDDTREVRILNVATTPYTDVGYFDASGNLDATSIFVSGNRGYVTVGDKLRSFDLTSKTGSRPQVGVVTLEKNGVDIFIRGTYAYVAINGGSFEMQIVNITNPASMVVLGNSNVNSQSGSALYVSEDGTKLYLGTTIGLFQKEFWVIDVSSKTGTRPVLDSLDLGLMSVTGLSVIQNRAIIVGWFGQEYQVVKVTTPTNIVHCGGISWNWGINDVATVIDSELNSWAYILTNDISGELHAILGGEEQGGGGGNGQGDQYLPYGEYESQVFDTTSVNTRYYSVIWEADMFANTELKFQIRTGTTSNLTAVGWTGPDGTASSYYTVSGADAVPSALQNKRYVQYKAFFYSNGVYTPVLKSTKVTYQN